MEVTKQQLLEKVEIEGTPFTAIKLDAKWFLTMGKYRISELYDTLQEVQQDAQDASWMRIMTIMNIMIQEDKALEKAKQAEAFLNGQDVTRQFKN